MHIIRARNGTGQNTDLNLADQQQQNRLYNMLSSGVIVSVCVYMRIHICM